MRAIALLLVLLLPALARAEEFSGPADAKRAACMVTCLAPKLPKDVDRVAVFTSPETTGYSYMLDHDKVEYQGVATLAGKRCCAKCLPLRVQTADALGLGVARTPQGWVYSVVR